MQTNKIFSLGFPRTRPCSCLLNYPVIKFVHQTAICTTFTRRQDDLESPPSSPALPHTMSHFPVLTAETQRHLSVVPEKRSISQKISSPSKKRRGSYKCGKCGLTKRGHTCSQSLPPTPTQPPSPMDGENFFGEVQNKYEAIFNENERLKKENERLNHLVLELTRKNNALITGMQISLSREAQNSESFNNIISHHSTLAVESLQSDNLLIDNINPHTDST